MELENTGVDVVESPAPAADITEIPAADTTNDWDSLVENATLKPDLEVDKQTDDVSTDEPAKPEADESDADSEPDAEPEKAADPDKAEDEPAKEEEAKPDEELSKRDKRTLNFKELQSERARLETENTALQTQITEKETAMQEVDAKLEQFGGIEGMTKAVEVLHNLANPAKVEETAAYIESLPHGQKLESIFACRALGIGSVEVGDEQLGQVVNNQTVAINAMLTRYQGLKNPLSADQVEKLGTYLALKLNDDPDEFFKDVTYDLEKVETPESKIKALEARVADFESGKAAKNGAEPAEAAAAQDPNVYIQELAQKFDTYESTTYPTVAEPILAEYGYDVKPTDPPELQKAKERFNDLVFAYQSLKNRESNAFAVVANYLEKNAETSDGFKFVEGDYKRAMRLSIRDAISELAPLFKAGGTVKPPPPKPKGSSIDVPEASRNSGKVESWEDLQKQSAPR